MIYQNSINHNLIFNYKIIYLIIIILYIIIICYLYVIFNKNNNLDIKLYKIIIKTNIFLIKT